jgi:WD40 repeat protein
MIRKFLFGDDIFISYSRKDGAKYAAALANELSNPANNFSCFYDQWGASAANELSKPVLRAIKQTSVLVLIGTAGAVNSSLVHQEVGLFSRARWLRSRGPVLPINIDGSLDDLTWSELTGLPRIQETEEARHDGIPSESVIRLIANSHSYTKRAERTRWLTRSALFLLVVSIAVSIFAGYQTRQARAETLRANTEAQRANAESINAKNQSEAAERNKADAEREADNARKSAIAAKEQERIATEKAREAAQQAAAARENATTARSQELAAYANSISPADPETGVLAAIDAIRVKPTTEAQEALRRTLLRFPEHEILRGSKQEIRSAEFSPDDRYVITTSYDGKARLHDVRTGELIKTFEDPQAPILSAAFSPNGKYIVLSGMNMGFGRIGIANNSRKDYGSNEFTEIVSPETATVLHRIANVAGTKVAFSKDSRFVVLSAADLRKGNISQFVGGRPALLELETGKSVDLPLEFVLGSGPAIFTVDNTVLSTTLAGVKERTLEIKVLDPVLNKVIAESKRPINTAYLPTLITSRASDQKIVAGILSDNLLLINSNSGSVIAEIEGPFSAADFSASGKLIAAGGDDGIVRVYKSETGESLGFFKGHPAAVRDLCFAQNDDYIVVAGNDNVLRIWSMREASADSTSRSPAEPLRSQAYIFEPVVDLTGHAGDISSVRVSQKGNLILSGGADGTARIWNSATFARKNDELRTTSDLHLRDIAFSPLGDQMVATEIGAAYLWNTETTARVDLIREERRDPSEQRELGHPVFSHDGKLLIIQVGGTYDNHKVVEVYDSDAKFLGAVPGEINPARGAAFSPDNKFVAMTNADAAQIWSVTERKIIKPRLSDASEKVVSIAFNPQGKSIVTASKTGTVHLWSFPAGRSIAKVQITATNPYQVGFSPNGRYVFVRDDGNTQWLWDIETRRVIPLAIRDQTVMRWGFSDDSSLVFNSDLTGTTLIERTVDGTVVSSIFGEILALSPNGKFAIDSRLTVWEMSSGRVFSKTVVPRDYTAIGLTLRRGEIIALNEDGNMVKRSLREVGSMDELLAIATKRAKPRMKNLSRKKP